MKKVSLIGLLFFINTILLSAQTAASLTLRNDSVFVMKNGSLEFLMKNNNNFLSPKDHVGKSFPDFDLTALDGTKFSNEKLKGKITLINCWFAACSPCVAEFEALNGLYEKLKDNPNFQFLSFTSDSPTLAQKSVEKYKLQFPVCPCDKNCNELNLGSAYPTNIILDESGRIVFFKSGGAIQKDQVQKNIDKMEKFITDLLSQQ